MNEIRRIESEAEEIARVRAIVGQYPLPEFVVDYTVELGEFDEEPAVWIKFTTNHRAPRSRDEGWTVGKEASELSLGAYQFLRDHYPDRRPYFRFRSKVGAETARA